MKTISIKWLQALDTDEVDEAIEEACVDCYGEDEQASGLIEMAGQELAFPFPATVLGEAVEVVDTASSKYDPAGFGSGGCVQGQAVRHRRSLRRTGQTVAKRASVSRGATAMEIETVNSPRGFAAPCDLVSHHTCTPLTGVRI